MVNLNKYDYEYTVGIIDNIEDITHILPFLEKHISNPNVDKDFYVNIINSIADARPYILIFLKDNEPHVVLIGRLEECRLPIKLGYFKIYSPKIKSLIILYGGILGEIDNNNSEIIINNLIKILKNNTADIIYFEYLRTDSYLFKLATKKQGMLFQHHFPKIFMHCTMTLTRDIQNIYKGMKSKHKSDIKRLPRILGKDFPDKIIIKYFNGNFNMDELLGDAESISITTYQRGLGVGFDKNDNIIKNRLLLSYKKGWIRGYMLYISDEPISYWIGSLYNNIFYLEYTGYKPKYKKYEPGTILFIKMAEDLTLNSNCNVIDFGYGDAFYKDWFGDQKHEEASIIIFSKNIVNLYINIIMTLADYLSDRLQYCLNKIGVKNKIKKWWRDRKIHKI